jgi:hypothetical protein
LLARELLGEQAVEEVEIGSVLLRGLRQERVDALSDVPEAESRERVDDAGVDEVFHDATSSTAS